MKKNHYRILTGSLVLLGTVLPTQTTHAASLYWDGTDTTADADGGAGTWDTSTQNWDTAATAGANAAFTATDTAIFGGTGGNVSLAAAITAAGINVNSNGYTIGGNALTLGANAINVAPGVTTTVASTINGTLNKTGTGTLILTGTNSFGGATVVSAGTLKVGPGSPNAFRYFRFRVTNKFNAADGYNQFSELHYYNQSDVWVPAGPGSSSSTGVTTGPSEQWWGSANDDKGQNGNHTKFGFGTLPYWLTYDFQTPQNLKSYNWSTANDSTPARNPARWQVLGSTDGTNFTLLDDRFNKVQVGPGTGVFYTWSAADGTTFTAVNSAVPNGGAANAYPIPYGSRTPMPTESPVQIAAGATFDVAGRDQTIASLADSAGGGGTVTNSDDSIPVRLEIGNNGTTNTTFSGVITDLGDGCEITLVKGMYSAQTLAGTQPNTYTGNTIIAGMGKLVLAKTAGVNAIPGNVSIATHSFAGNSSGLVLGANEQIANTGIVRFPQFSEGGGPQGDSYFRLNGYTETIRGLDSSHTPQFSVIENRGFGDAVTTYGNGRIIMSVPGVESYTYLGSWRNVDGGSNGGTVAFTKTGTGTQILGGSGINATGSSEVNQGTLRMNGSWGGPLLVTGAGLLEGTGSTNGLITVNGGGVFNPGVGGAGTYTNSGGTSIGSGGTVNVVSGTTLAGTVTVASGGQLNHATGGTVTSLVVATGGQATSSGTVTGALNVQAGGTLTVGNAAVATVTANAGVTLAGTVKVQADRTGGVFTNDKISNFTGITYGGTLEVTYTGEQPVLGEGIQFFAPAAGGATFAGGFSSVTGLPTLAAGNQWDLSELNINGTVRVVNTASKPTFNPGGGTFLGAQSLALTGDAGSTIYYTMDGSDPTVGGGTTFTYSSPINIPTDSDVTVKAFATLPGFTDSGIVTTIYRTITTPKWIVDANGDWNTTTNWDRGIVANGSGWPADFTLDQTAARIVNLNAARTVGKLDFANSNAFTWTLSSANSSVLTLAVPSGSPEIKVQNVDTTISASIAGNQGFTKTGAGTLILSGAKPYTGNVAINGGMISVDTLAGNGTNQPLGAGTTMSLDGGTLRYSHLTNSSNNFNRAITLGTGANTFDGFTATNFWFLTGVISGPGGFTKVGARQLIISGNNTYDGITNLNEAETQFRHVNAFGSTVGKTVVANGARVCAGGATVLNGTIMENFDVVGDGGNANGVIQSNDGGTIINFGGTINLTGNASVGGSQPFTISGAITGTGDLGKVNNNQLTINGTASNTFAGAFTMGAQCKVILGKTGGAIALPGNVNLASTAWNGNALGMVLAAPEQIADTGVVTWVNTGAESFLRLNGNSETVGGLVLATGPGTIENRGLGDIGTYADPTLTINVTGANSYVYNGGIRDIDQGSALTGGKISIVKTGTGTQTLGGGKTYGGVTTVSQGTLVLNGTSTLPSPITVASGATLKGTQTGVGTLTVATGATLAPGNSAGTLTTGSTVIDGTYACELDGATGDRLTVNGDLDIAGAVLNFDVLNAPTALSYVIASYTGTLTGVFEVIDLPEGYSVVYDADQKQIRLQGPLQSFANFASVNNLSGNADADFDHDGLADAVEWVLGTSPRTANSGSGPTAQVVSGNLVFTFNRSEASIKPDTTVTIETSSTLAAGAWTVYTVGADTASSTAPVTVIDNGDTDTITLSVPVNPDRVKFARLKVTIATPP